LKLHGSFSISLFLLCFSACGLFNSEEDEKVLARVGDQFLYATELKKLKFPKEEADSIAKVKNYIESWVNKQLLIQKALENLSEKQADFSNQLEDYKNSLLIYAYENQLINQKLDTAVSPHEIEDYYQSNKHNFALKEQLFKLYFVKVISTAPIQDSLKMWLFSDENFSENLMNYCTQFAMSCHLDSSQWLPLSSLKKVFPEGKSIEQFKPMERKQIVEDSAQSVLMHIFETKEVGEPAPVSYVRDQIVEIIINKRKLKLLSRAKQEIMEQATLENDYEIYE